MLVVSAAVLAEPAALNAGDAQLAQFNTIVDRPAPVPVSEAGTLETRLQRIERLSKRDPQQALLEIAALEQAALSPRAVLRLAAANARIAVYRFRMQDAIRQVEDALPRALKLGDPLVLGLLLNSRASALHELNRSPEALATADEARTQADRGGDEELRVDTRIFLVDFAARRGDYQRAFASLEEAEQIARRHAAAGPLAAVAYTGASLSDKIDDLPAALQGYAAAETGFREDADPLGEADAARRFAGLLIDAERYTEALDPLQRALARYHALRDDYGIAAATGLMARDVAGNGRPERGLLLNAEAIEALRRSDGSDKLAIALIDRAQLLVEHRRSQAAAALLDEARALLVRSDELRLRMRFHAVAASAMAALGRYREAHAALAELLQLRQHHDDQRLSRQLAAQRGRLESQRMAADLERARRQGEQQREALAQAERSARWQTALTLLALLSMAVALYALVRTARRSRRDAKLAQTDDLTGIQNRRRISDLGKRRLSECRDRGEPFSVLLLDLDHFKSVNDIYGHQTGDRALKAVADELKRHLRQGDELGRYGGEEFAVVLPATPVERAEAIADRLRAAIASLAPAELGLDGPLTVSVGVASADGEREFGALVARADRALYSAKEAGRNRVGVNRGEPAARSAAAVPAGADRAAALASAESMPADDTEVKGRRKRVAPTPMSEAAAPVATIPQAE